ncbi:MAG: NAD-dependent protein deacetylase [Acidimicrobiia bacterium]
MAELAALIERGGVVVLSGAGISTDSGIPDYRGDPHRVRRVPITYQEFLRDARARRRYWARSHFGWQRISRALPNPAHEAVARLEGDRRVQGIISQNVDGLHQAAGSVEVVELHGSMARTVCLSCGDGRSRLELHHRLEAANPTMSGAAVEFAPDGDAELPERVVDRFVTVDCLACGGVLKPDVVFFGENVARSVVSDAMRRVDEASALLVLGSSLTVMSGYRFVLAAHRQGTPVAIVNRGPTRGDPVAAVRVEGGLSEIMSSLIDRATPLTA